MSILNHVLYTWGISHTALVVWSRDNSIAIQNKNKFNPNIVFLSHINALYSL